MSGVRRNMTVEKAEKILTADGAVPESFTVLEVAWSDSCAAWFVKWVDDAEYDAWEDAMSDQSSPDVARNIDAFKPVERCSCVWENDDPENEGRKIYSVELLTSEDLKQAAEKAKDIVTVDKAAS